MVGQVTDIAPGQNQKGHAFAIRRAGGAIERLVVGLDIRGQAKGGGNGILRIEQYIRNLCGECLVCDGEDAVRYIIPWCDEMV